MLFFRSINLKSFLFTRAEILPWRQSGLVRASLDSEWNQIRTRSINFGIDWILRMLNSWLLYSNFEPFAKLSLTWKTYNLVLSLSGFIVFKQISLNWVFEGFIWSGELSILEFLKLRTLSISKLNSNPYLYKLKFFLTSKHKYNLKFQEFETVQPSCG